MPNRPTEKSVQYSLGEICGSINAIQEDISEIKYAMIPDGKHRVDVIEQKVQSLTVWKKTYTVVGALFIGTAGWLEAKINLIGDLFNG